MKFLGFILILFCFQIGSASEKNYQSILFVGDSHSYGPFGTVVDQALREQSEKVVSIASCGASASTWLEKSNNFKSTNCGYWKKTDVQKEIRTQTHQLNSLNSELSVVRPQVTVIALGTNMLGDVNGFRSELKAVEKLISQVQQSGSRCIWIGPPDLSKNPFKQNLSALNSELKTFVENKKCVYLDSTTVTNYQFSKSDGIHYPAKDSKVWGEKISKEIVLNLKTQASPLIPSLKQKNQKSAVQ